MLPDLTDTQIRVSLVLQRLTDIAIYDTDDARVLSDVLEDMLKDLHQSDFFGTEGQNDPRGDFREDVWHMTYVQGFDDE